MGVAKCGISRHRKVKCGAAVSIITEMLEYTRQLNSCEIFIILGFSCYESSGIRSTFAMELPLIYPPSMSAGKFAQVTNAFKETLGDDYVKSDKSTLQSMVVSWYIRQG